MSLNRFLKAEIVQKLTSVQKISSITGIADKKKRCVMAYYIYTA